MPLLPSKMIFQRRSKCYGTGGKRWNLVGLESRDKRIVQNSAIFCHVAIGSPATSALAAFLIFEQAHGTTCHLFLSCIFLAVLVPRLIELLTTHIVSYCF